MAETATPAEIANFVGIDPMKDYRFTRARYDTHDSYLVDLIIKPSVEILVDNVPTIEPEIVKPYRITNLTTGETFTTIDNDVERFSYANAKLDSEAIVTRYKEIRDIQDLKNNLLMPLLYNAVPGSPWLNETNNAFTVDLFWDVDDKGILVGDLSKSGLSSDEVKACSNAIAKSKYANQVRIV